MHYWVLVLTVISIFGPSSSQSEGDEALGDVVNAALRAVRSWETFTTQSSSDWVMQSITGSMEIRKKSKEDVQFWRVDPVNYEIFASLSMDTEVTDFYTKKFERVEIDITQGADVWVNMRKISDEIAGRLPSLDKQWGRPAEMEMYGRIPRGQEHMDQIDLGIGEEITPEVLGTAVELSETRVNGKDVKQIRVQLPCKRNPLIGQESSGIMGGLLEETAVPVFLNAVGECTHTMALSFSNHGIVQISKHYHLPELEDTDGEIFTMSETITRNYVDINGGVDFEKEPTHFYPHKRMPIRTKKSGISGRLLIVVIIAACVVIVAILILGIAFHKRKRAGGRPIDEKQEPLVSDRNAVSEPHGG